MRKIYALVLFIIGLTLTITGLFLSADDYILGLITIVAGFGWILIFNEVIDEL